MIRAIGYYVLFTLIVFLGLVYARPADAGSGRFEPPKYRIDLALTGAALDKDGNLYVIVNTWTSRERNLRRILPNHKIDEDFRLARLDVCCTVDPFLVDTDAEGNIYIVKYRRPEDDFVVVKYSPDGELDEGFATGGILEYRFKNPVDLAVRPDGFVYVLDMDVPEVFVVTPDGLEVREHVLQHYTLQRPAKLELGPGNEIYLFDLFDMDFSRYEIPHGVAALNPDGTPDEYFGTGYGGINSGDDPLNYGTFIVDADGSIWVLGPYSDAGPYSGAYHFDHNGDKLDLVSLEFRLGDDDPAVGIISDNENGFIIFEIDNLSLVTIRYDPDGDVREKFSVEIFRSKM